MAYPAENYPPKASFNPYASPEASIRPIPEFAGRASSIQFSVGNVLSRAWEVYQERMGFCIGVMLLGFAITFAAFMFISVGPALVGAIIPEPMVVGAVSFFFFAAYMLFALWVGIGQSFAYLKVAQGRPATIADLFAGARFLPKVMFAVIVLGFLAGGILLLGAFPGTIASAALGRDSTAAIVVLMLGILIAYLFLLVYWIAVSQFMNVLLDQPSIGTIESIKQSISITKGRRVGIAALFLIAGLVNLAGAMLLGIGLIFSTPLSFLILAVTYTALISPSAGSPAKPFTDDLL